MKSLFRNFRISLALALVFFLVGCDAPEPTGPSLKIKEGFVATYKVSGHLYRGEVTHAEDGYTAWEITWKNTPRFKYKTYRGLLMVFSEEEGVKSWSSFDTEVVDSLFPLNVGNEIMLEGRHYTKANQDGYTYYTTITVREKTEIAVKEEIFPVYIIDFSVVEDHPEGQRTFSKTSWYSEELETDIRTEYHWPEGTFSIRMVALEAPEDQGDDEGPEPEGLGTVRL